MTDLLFRPLFAVFVIELATRRVVHVGATRHPTDAWVAQQLRETTPFGQRPRYLIRDNDGKYGLTFARVADASGITILRTPYRAPRANAVCERFLGSVCMVFVPRDPSGLLHIVTTAPATVAGVRVLPRGPRGGETARGHEVRKPYSVRRECTDHRLVLGERHLTRVLREYAAYFNRARPHQGLGQATPEPPATATVSRAGPICAVPVLGGLHHAYQRAA